MAYDNTHYWANASFVRSVVWCAAGQGADIQEMCRAGGISPAIFEQAEARLSLEQNCRILDAALNLTGNAYLGLHVGEQTTAAVFGILGHLVNSSPTILAALEHLCKYLRTVSNIYEYHLEHRAGELFFYQEPIPAWNALSPQSARLSVEFSFAGFVRGLNRLQSRPLYPLRAAMRYACPGDSREYRRLLGVEPGFAQEANYLVFRLRELQAPLTAHNPATHRLFLELLEQQIGRTRAKETISGEVRRQILQLMGHQFPQLTDVAAALHMTPRTLQRKLQEEGAAFQSLADAVRSDIAIHLLRSRSLTVNEVAYKLGYAEPSVFRRAFKRWTGYPPKAFPG